MAVTKHHPLSVPLLPGPQLEGLGRVDLEVFPPKLALFRRPAVSWARAGIKKWGRGGEKDKSTKAGLFHDALNCHSTSLY